MSDITIQHYIQKKMFELVLGRPKAQIIKIYFTSNSVHSAQGIKSILTRNKVHTFLSQLSRYSSEILN